MCDPPIGRLKVLEVLLGVFVLLYWLVLLVGREVARIGRVLDPRDVRRRLGLVVDRPPVHVTEEGVLHDAQHARVEVAQAVGRVGTEHGPHERYEVVVGGDLELQVLLGGYDLLEDLGRVVGLEGRVDVDHFVDHAAEGPVVCGLCVTLGSDDFRREVLRGATHCERLVGRLAVGQLAGQSLREAEIDHFDIPLVVQQQVFGFEISVGDAQIVNVLKRQNDVGGIELH